MTKKTADLALGCISASISVLVVHQSILFLFYQLDLLPAQPWSLAPTGPWGVPRLINGMFWGGIWGFVYALVYRRLPGGPVLRGLCLGFMAVVLGNFLLVPLLKSQPLFLGGDGKRIALVLVIHLGFGIGTAFFFEALQRGKNRAALERGV